MTNYRRARVEGATYFFTVNCFDRKNRPPLVSNIDLLLSVIRSVKKGHPFNIDAMVVLPDHLHCIWTLPRHDLNYARRLRLIKAGFSQGIPPGESRSQSRIKLGERSIWQRRFWEHVIRDEKDLHQHIDYIHFNPVKHGWVDRVRDWPFSSFHRYVKDGMLLIGWGGGVVEEYDAGE